MARTTRRYRIRVAGTKYDYIRRYHVYDFLDPTHPRRVSNVALRKDMAQDDADDLNGVEGDDE